MLISNKNLVNILIQDSILQSVKINGIKKTIEIIENVYSNMPTIKDLFILNCYNLFNINVK